MANFVGAYHLRDKFSFWLTILLVSKIILPESESISMRNQSTRHFCNFPNTIYGLCPPYLKKLLSLISLVAISVYRDTTYIETTENLHHKSLPMKYTLSMARILVSCMCYSQQRYLSVFVDACSSIPPYTEKYRILATG